MPEKPKKLSELNKTHGNARPELNTIEQLLGDKGLSKYGTLDIKKYEETINKMEWFDLTNHALSIGLFPQDNKKLLKQNLLTAFREHVAKHKSQTANVTENAKNVTKKQHTAQKTVEQVIKKIFNS